MWGPRRPDPAFLRGLAISAVARPGRSPRLGFVGKDAETKQTSQNKKDFVRFSLTTQPSWKGKNDERQNHTDWHTVIVFGALAKFAAKLEKGDHLKVNGELRYREYENDNSEKVRMTEIIADKLSRMNAKKKEDLPDAANA